MSTGMYKTRQSVIKHWKWLEPGNAQKQRRWAQESGKLWGEIVARAWGKILPSQGISLFLPQLSVCLSVCLSLCRIQPKDTANPKSIV
jgi:hypothetical protein